MQEQAYYQLLDRHARLVQRLKQQPASTGQQSIAQFMLRPVLDAGLLKFPSKADFVHVPSYDIFKKVYTEHQAPRKELEDGLLCVYSHHSVMAPLANAILSADHVHYPAKKTNTEGENVAYSCT